MSRWDALKSDGGGGEQQQRRHRPRPGSGGGSAGNGWGRSSSSGSRGHSRGGSSRDDNRPWQPRHQQRTPASSLRRGGPSRGGDDGEARKDLDRNLRLLEQKLTEFQDAEPSQGEDSHTAAVKEILVNLQILQRQGWLRNDAKRLGWTIESLFRSVQCIATSASASSTTLDRNGTTGDNSVEPLVYDMTTETLQMLSGSNGGGSCSVSATSKCVKALVLRIRSVALVDATATSSIASAVPIANSMLKCLDAVFLEYGSALPAEETAERAVRHLLLPIAESASDTPVAGDDEESHRHVLCRPILPATLNCISSLVSQNTRGAILAPLVLDITNDGDERQVTNPLRPRLLSLFQGLLLRENDNLIVGKMCGCFSDILDAIYFIDRGSRARGKALGTDTLNMASVARRIRTLLERSGDGISANGEDRGEESGASNLRVDILRLLSSLARAFPKVMAGQWAFFLEETMVPYDPLSSPLKSASSGSTASSSLLVTFIRSGSMKEKLAAMEASKALVCAMPLKLWFGLSARRRTFTGTTSLPNRVAKAMGQLFGALKSAISEEHIESESIRLETCRIVEVMIQTEPIFCDESLALVLTDLLTTMRMLLSKCLSKSESGSEVDAAVAIIEAFVKGIGGTINSTGDLIPLSRPVEKWLENAENRKFLLKLFSMLVGDDGSNEDITFLDNNAAIREKASILLMHVLRMAPSIINDEKESGWTSRKFTSAVQNLLDDNDPKKRQLGLQFVHHYVQGRNDFLLGDGSPFVSEAFGTMLLRALVDINSGVRSLSAETYGLLLSSDWAILLKQSSDHFYHLLQRCVSKDLSTMGQISCEFESVAGVRSKACKAIGNMCSECCGDSGRGETLLHIGGLDDTVCNVLNTVTTALGDENPGVRGMALYCIGNLTLSLQSSPGVGGNGLVANSSLPTMCALVRKCLEDKNDKVVGNAIRTSGHLLNLLRSYGHKGFVLMSEPLYRDTISILTQKLKLALDIAEGKAVNMSWKQRSFAKKHSWGACHTLGGLLQCASSENESNHKLFLPAISQMIHCIQISDRLAEKVTAAAAAALKQIPMDVWTEFCGGMTTIISDGLVACLVVVYEESRGHRTTKLSLAVRTDIQDLLDQFLAISSADDAISSFSNETISPGTLDFLYSWMVNKGSKSSSFDSIATALTSNDRAGEFEISIEQRFSSRARHERRRERISPLTTKADHREEEESFVSIKSNTSSRDVDDDSDQEDEL